MLVHKITTIDNPFDPFEEFEDWNALDVQLGHNTCSLLARFDYNSSELSERDQLLSTEQAIDDIISVDALNIYRKVSKKIKN